MSNRFIEDRLTKALNKHKANMNFIIGEADIKEQKNEVAVALIRALFFSKSFNEFYEEIDSKMVSILKNCKKKQYYCKDLGYMLQLDEDDIISIIEK